jgi:hypothetical protein
MSGYLELFFINERARSQVQWWDFVPAEGFAVAKFADMFEAAAGNRR